MKFIILILFATSTLMYGQAQLSGTIIDKATHKPVPFATVYISGTTQGTITGNNGTFWLDSIKSPAKIIISHVSYEPKVIHFNRIDSVHLNLKLQQRKVDLPEVTIKDKNLREENVKMFTQWFLGVDEWGADAKLLNDSVLHFQHDYEYFTFKANDSTLNLIRKNPYLKIFEWNEDSTEVTARKKVTFNVSANAPLIIDKPTLGYRLHVDLFHFTLYFMGGVNRSSFLGYYYFQPYQTTQKWKQKEYERNREKAFYNSSQHFYRAFYNNQLAENGYKLVEKVRDTVTYTSKFVPVNIDTCIVPVNDTQLEIVDLKDKKFNILYFQNMKGEPIDLSKRRLQPSYYKRSEIYFLEDTCLLNADGIVGDNCMMFGGTISDKIVGAFLPADYQLPQKRKTKIEESE